MSQCAPCENLHAVGCGGARVLYDANRVRTYRCSALEAGLLDAGTSASTSAADGGAEATDVARARERIDRLCRLSERLASCRGLQPEYSGHPSFLFLNVCYACNLDCEYCYASDCGLGNAHLFMSRETARASVEFLLRRPGPGRSFRISFAGGEPLLNLDAIRAAVGVARSRARAEGLSLDLRVLTNGTVMSPKILDFLTRNDIFVQISLDGPPEMHDRLRPTRNGSGSSEKILETIELLERNGFSRYAVRGTICHSNADPERLTAFFRSRGFPDFVLRPLMGEGDDPHRLSPEDAETVVTHYREVGRRVASRIAEGADEEVPSDLALFLARLELGAKTKRYCGAGRELLVVDPQGDFYPCPAVAGDPRFRTGSLATGFDAAPVEVLPNPAVDDKEGCRGCWARNLCGGGCSFQAMQLNGDVGRPDPVECDLIRARAEASIEIHAARQGRQPGRL